MLYYPYGREVDAVENKKFVKKKVVTNCESCVYYDFDEDLDAYVCIRNLDEDEMERFLAGRNHSCPYYRFYDEYKSVHKQIWQQTEAMESGIVGEFVKNVEIEAFCRKTLTGDLHRRCGKNIRKQR